MGGHVRAHFQEIFFYAHVFINYKSICKNGVHYKLCVFINILKVKVYMRVCSGGKHLTV